MKYFVPKIQPTDNLIQQTGFSDKLGGLPFGLPDEIYPICKECNNPMTFVAQFIHQNERLDLGKEGRALFIFVCDYEGNNYSVCQSWDAESGANSCLVLEPEEFTNTKTEINVKAKLTNELVITEWQEFDDQITKADSEYFLDTKKYDELNFTDFVTLLEKTDERTKLGSVPYWIQYPELTNSNYRFVGQLDSNNGFEFGDVGIGYIFIENTENSEQLPQCKFLWQCS